MVEKETDTTTSSRVWENNDKWKRKWKPLEHLRLRGIMVRGNEKWKPLDHVGFRGRMVNRQEMETTRSLRVWRSNV